MRLRLNTSLRRALMAAMATACTLLSSTAWGGVADARYDLQYYLDFARNKGMFSAGATNISVYFKDGNGQSNPTIPLMPNLDSYAQRGQVIMGSLSPLGGANLVAPQYVNSAYHCPESDVYFLSENGSMAVCYSSTGYAGTGAGDWSMQRLNKVVTEVAYTPMASEEFLLDSLNYGDWLYRLGNGGSFDTEGNGLNPGSNALGGMIDVASVSALTNQGDYRIHASLWSVGPPLEIGVTQGDSGSPVFAWDAENNRFLYLASLSSGNPVAGYSNYLNAHNNPEKAQAFMDNYTISVSGFSGEETIIWGAQDGSTGKGQLTQGDTSYEYTGSGTSNSVKDHMGLTFSTADAQNIQTQTLELQGSVNMGAGALTFDSGSWKLTETDASHTFNSAGFVVNAGAELTLELTASANEEWRKVGEGVMTIAGSGDNNAVLRVGGGETKYIIETDEAGNITGCTLGNAGETRLARQDGYAASSVRLEAGVAIIVLMADNQFKTNTTAGDTFTFGNAGGLLNLNGHDLTWGVINQQGSGTGARIGNFTPQNEATPGIATFTYTGTGTFQGCFMDEGEGGAQLAVNYNNADGGTWVLTGNHSNAGGFTVSAGTMVLQGSNTPHVMMTDSGDWTYATMMGADVTVKSGATFRLSHHALMTGNVTVENGGSFVLNQTVNAVSESISGSLRQDMTDKFAYSFKGDVTLNTGATMRADISSPVATTMQGNITGTDTNITQFTKQGSGVLVVQGNVNIPVGAIETGGLVIHKPTDSSNWWRWNIGEQGFLAVVGMENSEVLNYVGTGSSGVLALTQDQTTALDLSYRQNLYIGAYGDEAITYGTAGAELAANSNGQWLLGGGTGTLEVAFKLTGENDLIIGNEYSSGTVHLTNTSNDFTGTIYIKGLGNMLTYENGALGQAKVSLSYGNAMSLYDASQFDIIDTSASGVLAIASGDADLNLSGKNFSLGANGDLTYTGTLTVGAEDTYRFGGVGNLTLDTALNQSTKMELDGQGMSGSSVTFARQNAFAGDIVAGGGLYLDSPNSTGNIAIHAGHEEALAAASSIELQKGATLYTDGKNLTVSNLSVQTGAAVANTTTQDSTLQLHVTENTSTTIANGALQENHYEVAEDVYEVAGIHLVKTGAGTLTLGQHTSWTGGLTVKEGTVKVNGNCSDTVGLGVTGMSIMVEADGTLDLTFNRVSSGDIDQTRLPQYIKGNGTVRVSSGGAILFSDNAAGFTGTVEVAGNTRLYIGQNLCGVISPHATYENLAVFKDATINVTAGSQARITNMFRYGEVNGSASTTSADFIIAGTGFAGTDNGLYGSGSEPLLVAALNSGALSVDLGSVITGNVTLADDATISSWSKNATETFNWGGHYYGQKQYGRSNKLGGTLRGLILGAGKTLTLGGNEGLTFTADSANTYGDLLISNGNGNNDDKFALRLNGGAARSQTSTALGTGSVTLQDGLILRLAGTGTADNTDIVYTYENGINAGAGATLQSYNITNRLTNAVVMSGDSLNLATANGGVLELAGGINGSGTLNVAAGSKVILGSASAGYAMARTGNAQFIGTVAAGAGADITLASPAVVAADTTFTGTDSLTLRLSGTEDFTLGGISLAGSQVTVDEVTTTTPTSLTLHFDFTNTPVAAEADTWSTLTLKDAITADSTTIALDLNMFSEINSGSYTLISQAGSSTNYTLADTMNGRLSLSTETGALVLTVGGDNRLYWRTDGESQDWNTTDANWYSDATASQGLAAFTDSANVMLDATGTEEGNSAENRETITLSDPLTVGTIGVQEDAYELTGSGAISATSLTVGAGGDLKLSNTGANTFDNGIVVNDASLTISSAAALTANVSVENDASFALVGGSMTGQLTVTDASASLSNATLTGNIKTDGTGSLSLSAATFSNAGSSIAFDYGSLSVTAGTQLGGTYRWEENQPTVQVENMAIAGGTLTSTVALQADSLDMASGSALVLNHSTGAQSSISTITGAGSLTKQGSDALSLGSAALSYASLQGGETNITGATTISGQLSVAKATLNIEEGGSLTVSQFTAGNEKNGNSSVVNINGGTLTITGSTAGDTNSSSFLLAHWRNLTSVLTLNSGSIVAENATMHMGWDSGATFKALGGEATLKGVLFGTSSDGSGSRYRADTFELGTATTGSATLKIGSAGFAGIRSEDTVKFGEGTITATADFAISGADEPAVQLIGTVGGTIFYTNGHTITVNTAINGEGKVTKRGTGTLALTGSGAAFTGQLAVEAGALQVNTVSKDLFASATSVSIGESAVLDLSAIDFAVDGNAISLGASTTVSFADSATVALGSLEEDTIYSIFNAGIGELDGWVGLSVANFTMNGMKMADMGRGVSVSLDSLGTFSYSIDSWDLVWNGPATGGTWDTTDSEWQTTRPNAETGEPETISTTFVSNDNVTFNSTASVSLSSNITANEVRITNGATLTLSSNVLTANKITIESGSKLNDTFASVLAGVKTFELASGAELGIKYSGSPTYTSEVMGEGTIVLSGGGSMTWNPTDGTLNMGTLTIKDANTSFTTDSAFSANVLNMTNGTATFNGTTSITTANFNGGTVNFATESLSIGTFNRGSGNVNFKLANGVTQATYNLGAITGANAGTMTIDQGVTVNVESISTTHSNVSRKLVVNGVLNIDKNLNYNGYYSAGETFEGNGVINVTGDAYVLMYDNEANFAVNELNIGGKFILDVYAYGAKNFNIKDGVVSVTGQVDNTRGGAGTGSDYAYLNIVGGSLVMEGGSIMNQGQLNIRSGSLVQAGGVSNISNTVNMTGGELSVTGGTMNIASTAVTGSGGSISVSGGELVLSASAAEALLGGVSEFSLSGGELDLSAMNFSTEAAGAISLASGAEFSFGADGVIALGALASDTVYHIFDATDATLHGWDTSTLSASNFMLGDSNLAAMGDVTLTLGDTGTFFYTLQNGETLIWAGGATGTWDKATANWDATPDVADDANAVFGDGKSVLFNSDAAVSLDEDIYAGSVKIANGATVSLDESAGKLTASTISVGEGAKLSLSAVRTDANIGSNITGLGTVELSAGTGWNSVITMGNGFTGETHLKQGQVTLVHSTNGSAVVGSKLVLLTDNADIQLTNIGNQQTTWAGNLELRGTHEMHSNSNTDFTFAGNVTGEGTYAKQSTGKLTFGENGSVNLGKFTQSGGETIFAGATTLQELAFTGGSITLWNAAAASGASKSITTLKMGNGMTIATNDRDVVTAATTIGTLQMDGTTATVQDTHHSGWIAVHNITGGADSTLNLVKNAQSNNVGIFTLGDAEGTTESGSAFAGTISVKQATVTGNGHRDVALLLNHATVAQAATIDLNSATTSADANGRGAYVGLGVNVASATIGGLKSGQALGERAILFSGSQASNAAWADKSATTEKNTLTINTANGATHEYYGQVQNVNLVIDGEGTQKFLGTSNSFNGTVTVQGGTAAFNDAGTSLLEHATAFTLSNEGVLDLSAISFGSDAAAANAIALASGATFTFSDNLDNDGGLVIDLGALSADTTYQIFDLSAENASLAGWNLDTLDLANFRINGALLADLDYADIALGEDGTFWYSLTDTNTPDVLYWVGGETGTWNTTDTVWDSTPDDITDANTNFSPDAHVAFNSSAAVDIAGTVQAASLTVEGADTTLSLQSGNLTVTDMYLEGTLDMADGVTLTVNNTEEVSISGITGSGKLVKNGSGTLELGDAELHTLDFTHNNGSYAQAVGELHITGTVSIADTLCVGDGTLTIGEDAVVTTKVFQAVSNGKNANSRIEIAGGSLTITGTDDVDGETTDFILGYWHNSNTSSAQLTLSSGTLTAENTSLYMGYDSPGVFKALGGEATLKGIRFRNNAADADTVELGTATSANDSVTLTIGSTGIVGMASNDVIKLGGGTLKASADFAITAQSGATPSVSLIGTTAGTVFDTNGHNITVNTVLSGSGKLVKNSTGNLKFTAANTYTGATTINAGSIVLDLGTTTNDAGDTVNRTYTLGGTVSGSGTLEVAAGTTLKVANNKTISSALLVNGGVVDVTANNNKVMAGNITVQNGGELKFTYSGSSDQYDCFAIDSTARTITLDNGTLDLGAMRHTMQNWSITMSNGSLLKGTGSSYTINNKSYTAALDVATSNMTISSTSGDNEISAVTRLRTNTLKYNVTGGTLTISGEIMSDGSNPAIAKEGSGDLIFTRDHTFAGTTTISAGKLVMDLGTVTTGEGENAVTTNGMYTLDGAVSGAGTLQVMGGTTVVADAAAETISTAVILEKGSVLKLANGTTNTLSKEVTKGTSGAGTLQVDAGTTLENAGKTISADLVLNGGNATLSGNKTISGDITIHSGSVLTAGGSNDDTLVYADENGDYTRTLTINARGELALGDRRWSIGNENKGSGGSVYDIVLNGGKITGNGTVTSGTATGNLDFFENGKISATGTTGEISAEIRVRNDNNKLALTVTGTDDKLEVSGNIVGNGGISKSGAGKLVLSGANTYADDTQITAGTLELQGAGKLGAGDVSIAAGAELAAATTATLDGEGNVTTESETWASVTSTSDTAAAAINGATITQQHGWHARHVGEHPGADSRRCYPDGG